VSSDVAASTSSLPLPDLPPPLPPPRRPRRMDGGGGRGGSRCEQGVGLTTTTTPRPRGFGVCDESRSSGTYTSKNKWLIGPHRTSFSGFGRGVGGPLPPHPRRRGHDFGQGCRRRSQELPLAREGERRDYTHEDGSRACSARYWTGPPQERDGRTSGRFCTGTYTPWLVPLGVSPPAQGEPGIALGGSG
jgi:hypothetical protein